MKASQKDAPYSNPGGLAVPGPAYAKPGKLKFSETEVDPSVQREVVKPEVDAIAADFDREALGFISVSVRSTGQNILLDGLQRKTAASMVDFDEPVDCIFHYNLTRSQEAALFRRLNFRSNVSSIAGYKVAITEGLPEALAVDAVLREFGIPIGSGRGGAFQAVRRALRIVSQPDGVDDLRFAFSVATFAFVSGTNVQPLDGVIIEALAMIHRRYKDAINIDDLKARLASRSNGQPGIMGEARTRKGIRGGKLPVAVVDVILAEYNLRRTKSRLPEWAR